MIEVRDYDPAWQDRFEALRSEYAAALEAAAVPVRSIEHVGSTSVPGLAAKPIIDIDIVVDPSDVDDAAAVLVALGFEPEGEIGVPQRWAFRPPDRLAGTNTYVTVAGSLSLRNHLGVRDTLRADADLRAEYGDVKKRVGAVAADIYEYGAGKNAIIQRVLAVAGLSEDERASIDGNQVPVRDRRH